MPVLLKVPGTEGLIPPPPGGLSSAAVRVEGGPTSQGRCLQIGAPSPREVHGFLPPSSQKLHFGCGAEAEETPDIHNHARGIPHETKGRETAVGVPDT